MGKNILRYASLALPLPINTPFLYSIPSGLTKSAEFGRRAVVPFGKRILTGFIIDILDTHGDIPASKLKPNLQLTP